MTNDIRVGVSVPDESEFKVVSILDTDLYKACYDYPQIPLPVHGEVAYETC